MIKIMNLFKVDIGNRNNIDLLLYVRVNCIEAVNHLSQKIQREAERCTKANGIKWQSDKYEIAHFPNRINWQCVKTKTFLTNFWNSGIHIMGKCTLLGWQICIYIHIAIFCHLAKGMNIIIVSFSMVICLYCVW